MKKESENKNKKLEIGGRKSDNVRQRLAIGTFLLTSAICLLSSGVLSAGMSAGDVDKISAPPTLEETRLKMDKWLETQQIISRERKDWQQGKEILLSRLELVKKEIATLEEKNKQAESSVTEANKKRSELLAENDQLTAAGAQLTGAVAGHGRRNPPDVQTTPGADPDETSTPVSADTGRSVQDTCRRRRTVPKRSRHP